MPGEVPAAGHHRKPRGAGEQVAFRTDARGADEHDICEAADGAEDLAVRAARQPGGGAVGARRTAVDARDEIDAQPWAAGDPVQPLKRLPGILAVHIDRLRAGERIQLGETHAAIFART